MNFKNGFLQKSCLRQFVNEFSAQDCISNWKVSKYTEKSPNTLKSWNASRWAGNFPDFMDRFSHCQGLISSYKCTHDLLIPKKNKNFQVALLQ